MTGTKRGPYTKTRDEIISGSKMCKKCGTRKTLSEFYRFKGKSTTPCKQCRTRSAEDKIKHRINNKKWRARNYAANREEEIKKVGKWRSEHPEKVKEYRKITNARRNGTLKGKLVRSMSKIGKSLRGSKSRRHWVDLVDFTVDQLKKHLEKHFERGMTWDNYGSYWHIDHIIPISAFNFERPEDMDFKRCWCLKNLQPLEAKENMSKHNKIDRPFQPALTI